MNFCSCLSAGYCCSLDRAVLILTGQLLGLGRFHAMSLCCPYCSLVLSLQRLKNFLGCFTKFCSQCGLCSLAVSLEVFLMCKCVCTLSICWQSTLCLCWWSHVSGLCAPHVLHSRTELDPLPGEATHTFCMFSAVATLVLCVTLTEGVPFFPCGTSLVMGSESG